MQISCGWAWALLLCLALAPQLYAQNALFSSIITIESKAASQEEGRKAALPEAARQGMAQLLDKLAPGQKSVVLPSLDAAGLEKLVRGTEIIKETFADGHYSGQFKVNYDALAVNQLFDNHVSAEGIPDKLKHSPSVLIVPLYEEGGTLMLWEADNPWRDIWSRVGIEQRGGNLVVPYGDNLDAGALKAETAGTLNFAGYARLINRYGVGGVITLKATLKADPLSLLVVRRVVTREITEVLTFEYQADPQEDKDALLVRAARDLAAQIDRQREELLARKAPVSNAETEVMAITAIRTLDGWTKLRAILANNPSIEKLDMLAVSPKQADMLLHFKGTRASLLASLRAAGLTVQEEKGYWIINHE